VEVNIGKMKLEAEGIEKSPHAFWMNTCGIDTYRRSTHHARHDTPWNGFSPEGVLVCTLYLAPAMYGIVRMPSKWRVTLSRGGQKFLRDFAFSRYSGESAALACAQAYRDEVVRQHPPMERRELARKLLPSNKSGVAGVTFRLNARGEIMSWHAITRVSVDRVLTKSFGVGRYGAAQAERLAIAEREKQLVEQTVTLPDGTTQRVLVTALSSGGCACTRHRRRNEVERFDLPPQAGWPMSVNRAESIWKLGQAEERPHPPT
jgi:hypothetical protein